MRIETLLSLAEIDEAVVKSRTVVIVDVLRACTTIAYALSHGCESIIPVESVEAATKLASSLERGSALLGGEREGKRLDGFDLGNSPSEYTTKVVKKKAVILTTSNGTRAIALSQGAKEIVIASFVNMSAVVRYIGSHAPRNLTVICSGQDNRFALEDAVCAGMLIGEISKTCEYELGDGSQAALSLYGSYKDSILEILKTCEHGRHLAAIGFGEDLNICAKVNSFKIVPIVKDGRITAARKGRGGSRQT